MGNGSRRTKLVGCAGDYNVPAFVKRRDIVVICTANKTWTKDSINVPCKCKIQQIKETLTFCIYFSLFSLDYSCTSPPEEALTARNNLLLINNSLLNEELVFTARRPLSRTGFHVRTQCKRKALVGPNWAFYLPQSL